MVHAGQSFTSLFKFDKTTGKISDHVDLGTPGYTAAFSPACNMLYIGDGVGRNIFQFNLAAEAIPQSKVLIGTTDATGVGAMQLGPDGKIYIARFVSSNTLGVIADPNRRGSRSVFVDNGISLGGKIGKGGLPNFPNTAVGSCAATAIPRDIVLSNTGINVQVQSIIGNGATIVWNPNPGAFSNTVMYREKGTKTWTVEETTENIAFLENLNTNSDYEVVVLPKEDVDNDYIAITEHLIDDVLPAANVSYEATDKKNITTISFRNKSDFSIAPNPASNNVTLDLRNINSEEKSYVRITDVSGVEVYSEVLNTETATHNISTSNLKGGMYFISILSDTNDGKKVLETKKLLVAH